MQCEAYLIAKPWTLSSNCTGCCSLCAVPWFILVVHTALGSNLTMLAQGFTMSVMTIVRADLLISLQANATLVTYGIVRPFSCVLRHVQHVARHMHKSGLNAEVQFARLLAFVMVTAQCVGHSLPLGMNAQYHWHQCLSLLFCVSFIQT